MFEVVSNEPPQAAARGLRVSGFRLSGDVHNRQRHGPPPWIAWVAFPWSDRRRKDVFVPPGTAQTPLPPPPPHPAIPSKTMIFRKRTASLPRPYPSKFARIQKFPVGSYDEVRRSMHSWQDWCDLFQKLVKDSPSPSTKITNSPRPFKLKTDS